MNVRAAHTYRNRITESVKDEDTLKLWSRMFVNYLYGMSLMRRLGVIPRLKCTVFRYLVANQLQERRFRISTEHAQTNDMDSLRMHS